MTKKPLTIRISEDGRDLLEQLHQVLGASYTAIIERAIRELAKSQKDQGFDIRLPQPR